MPAWIERLGYSVEVFDASNENANLVEVLARVSEMDMPRATFNAARRKHPDRHMALCRKAQIIVRTRRGRVSGKHYPAFPADKSQDLARESSVHVG